MKSHDMKKMGGMKEMKEKMADKMKAKESKQKVDREKHNEASKDAHQH